MLATVRTEVGSSCASLTRHRGTAEHSAAAAKPNLHILSSTRNHFRRRRARDVPRSGCFVEVTIRCEMAMLAVNYLWP
jgi:hypothetical protein